MVTSELIDYIKKEQMNSSEESSIRQRLLAKGWNETDIASAFQSVNPAPKEGSTKILLPKYKKMLLLILICTGILLLLIVGLTLYKKKPAFSANSVQIPTYIPSGFSARSDVKLDVKDNEKFFLLEYANQDGKTYTYTAIHGDTTYTLCQPIENGPMLLEYTEFRPPLSDDGCAITIVKNGGISKDRLYKWKSDQQQYSIMSFDLSIDDTEAMKIATSLTNELILTKNIVPETSAIRDAR